MYKIVSWVLVFGIMGLFGVELDMQQPSIKKDFLIVKSTKSYKEAESFAGKLATRMDMKYMKEVQFNKETGLTHSKKMCKEGRLEYPCYVSRGRYDDGVYVSVEYSNDYAGFARGYYLVIVASGSYAKTTLKQIKRYEPSAYVKSATIYMGCIH